MNDGDETTRFLQVGGSLTGLPTTSPHTAAAWQHHVSRLVQLHSMHHTPRFSMLTLSCLRSCAALCMPSHATTLCLSGHGLAASALPCPVQVWLTPDQRGHKPQYGSAVYTKQDRHNQLLHLLGGTGSAPQWRRLNAGKGTVRLHQVSARACAGGSPRQHGREGQLVLEKGLHELAAAGASAPASCLCTCSQAAPDAALALSHAHPRRAASPPLCRSCADAAGCKCDSLRERCGSRAQH